MVSDWIAKQLRRMHLLHTWNEYEQSHQPGPMAGHPESPEPSRALMRRIEVRRECLRCGRDEPVRVRHERVEPAREVPPRGG